MGGDCLGCEGAAGRGHVGFFGWVSLDPAPTPTYIDRYKCDGSAKCGAQYESEIIPMDDISKPDIMTTLKAALDNLFGEMKERGETHTTVRDAIDKVVARTQVKVSIANGVVPLLLQEWEAAGHGEVLRGRRGGIWVGGRKKHVDMRARCPECHQVLRPMGQTKKGEE
jgi:hypothetical protein